jgi:hypothetical protein
MKIKEEYIVKAEFTRFDNSTNWVDGIVDKYRFQAKLFDEGSTFGINDGRVSKLMIWDEAVRQQAQNIFEGCIVNYDRGWDIEPQPEHKIYFNAVMELLENSPKRFE